MSAAGTPSKKAVKAAQVEINRFAAFSKKVRSLVGHVPVSELNLGTAYHAGLTAEDYAAQVASREPVGAAVHPLKVEAVEAAEKAAQRHIEKLTAKLEAAGMDLNVVAPRGDSIKMGYVGYKAANAWRAMFHAITRSVEGVRRPNDPVHLVTVDPKLCARVIQQWREGAAQQYDAFICKLVTKIGPCDSAKIDGSHVWAHSILTVTKGAAIERWHTQQIENRSVLGNYFPQWPTRLLKEGK